MNKKFICLVAAGLALAAVAGCGEKKEMPENIISYKEKEGSELVPVEGVESGGSVAEAGPEDKALPTADELGDYQEVFMEGDIIDDHTKGGWVVAVSLNGITVNTYNELTTYAFDGDAAGNASLLKPGDAVLLSWYAAEDGTNVVYELGRVRVEDEALTRDEIVDMYNQANAAQGGGTETDADE